MLDPKIKFIFYAAAVACFVLAAVQSTGRGGGGRGALTRVSLVPLGLALFVFPAMWDTGAAAF